MKNTEKSYLANLLKSLDELMESLGFKRHSLTYYKKMEHYWFLIDWQLSKDKIPDKAKFTINIGVYDPNLARMLREDVVSYPDVWSCHLRQRVGHLLPNSSDKWWLLPLNLPIASASSEFEYLIIKTIVPYLSTFDSAESLLNLWKSGISPGLTEGQRLDFINTLLAQH